MEYKKILESRLGPIIYGLDIGMASVGWAVLAESRIVALGVRAFDKAETAKEGESLNLARRSARLMRRRLQQAGMAPDQAGSGTKTLRVDSRRGIFSQSAQPH